MHDGRSLTGQTDVSTRAAAEAPAEAATQARCGGAESLARALEASRRDTLCTFAVYEAALPGLAVPLRAELNPPLWELGHIGWFQEYWIARNPARALGHRADPDVARAPSVRAGAEALYHSSRVPHDERWSLPLPDADETRADLAQQLARTLELLAGQAREELGNDDDALYFHRLALLHEDMHHEAALYMAQGLGIAIGDPRWQCKTLPAPPAAIGLDAGTWTLGQDGGGPASSIRGFSFDNELGRLETPVPACRIDAQVVRWAEFMPFVDAGGYDEPRFWSEAGWAWRHAQRERAAGADAGVSGPPRYLRRDRGGAGGWQCWRHGRWQPLDLALPACHLTLHEAEAWCRWAGRRLPTEAEWERAALTRPEAFAWGAVWEWTASPFAPFPGFVPHPYRDYSAPWFDGRPVLRGASFMTQPRMKHPRCRNFFQAHRSDVPAGFRSCVTG